MILKINDTVQEVSDIRALLKQIGINPTPQRVEIAGILLGKPQHLSADQILKALQRRNSSVSKATVYNTLNLFVEKGLARQMVIDPDRVFYDSNTSAHYHFYNRDTCELVDVDASRMEIHGIPELPDNTRQCGVDVIIHLKNKP
jgi:Fur family iron response transcriptional regulator